MISNTGCEKCRRAGAKLFLKGERCNSPACSMLKKPYAPGQKAKRRKRPLSEYGKELAEKQKLKFWYNLKESQLRKYVKATLNRKTEESTGDMLIKRMENRMDNFCYRAGFSFSRPQARQMVSHGFFSVNGKPVNIPSYEVKKGDVVSVREGKRSKKAFEDWGARVKNYTPPAWISLDKKKIEAKMIGDAAVDEIMPPVELSSVFEFYSR